MELSVMEQEIHRYVLDPSLRELYKDWVNDAILELASDYDFPALKMTTPVDLSCTSASHLVDLPEDYHKNLYKGWDSNYSHLRIWRDPEEIERRDPSHAEIRDHVSHIAVRPKYDTLDSYEAMVYPRATEVLKIYYYRKPKALVKPTDQPVFFPSQFHRRVIIPMAIVRGYTLLGDMSLAPPHESIGYWESKITEGLYGRTGGPPGLLNWLNNQRPPQRRGGRQALP